MACSLDVAVNPGVVKIVIRGDSGVGKSTLLRMLHEMGEQMASPSAKKLFWFSASSSSNGHEGKAVEWTPKDTSYLPTRQIQVANIQWKYKGTSQVTASSDHLITCLLQRQRTR